MSKKKIKLITEIQDLSGLREVNNYDYMEDEEPTLSTRKGA